jgi:hypothetical protein
MPTPHNTRVLRLPHLRDAQVMAAGTGGIRSRTATASSTIAIVRISDISPKP